VGSAQRTEGRVILQHGSLLVDGSQAAAEELLLGGGGRSDGPDPAPDGWTTLAAELGDPPMLAALATALAAGFSEVLGITLAPDSLAPEEAEAVERLRGHFASDSWTWRL
jgi:lipoate-protein ligase A